MNDATVRGLHEIADDKALLEIGRKAIEDILIEWRDMRLSIPFRNNGLVVKEYDGTPSSTIRLAPEEALRIGLLAIAKHLSTLERSET